MYMWRALLSSRPAQGAQLTFPCKQVISIGVHYCTDCIYLMGNQYGTQLWGYSVDPWSPSCSSLDHLILSTVLTSPPFEQGPPWHPGQSRNHFAGCWGLQAHLLVHLLIWTHLSSLLVPLSGHAWILQEIPFTPAGSSAINRLYTILSLSSRSQDESNCRQSCAWMRVGQSQERTKTQQDGRASPQCYLNSSLLFPPPWVCHWLLRQRRPSWSDWTWSTSSSSLIRARVLVPSPCVSIRHPCAAALTVFSAFPFALLFACFQYSSEYALFFLSVKVRVRSNRSLSQGVTGRQRGSLCI